MGYLENYQGPVKALASMLSGMRRSALPIVEQVERDDSL